MQQSYLHHFLFTFIYTSIKIKSVVSPHRLKHFHGTLHRRYLLIDHYHWIIIHYLALTFTLLLSTAALFYLPLSSSLPSADVHIWQLTVGFFSSSLIRTLEVLIGHYTLFLGPPAGPPPLLQTLWSSDEIFQGNNRFLCTPIAVLRKQKAHIKTGNAAERTAPSEHFRK